MSYIHDGKKPVTSKNDPIDPDSADWEFFYYDDWLRTGESITSHSASIEGGTVVTDSTYLGTMVDDAGISHDQTYGVKCKASAGATAVVLTHRVSTATTGAVNLGRTDIDHTVIIPVKSL